MIDTGIDQSSVSTTPSPSPSNNPLPIDTAYPFNVESLTEALFSVMFGHGCLVALNPSTTTYNHLPPGTHERDLFPRLVDNQSEHVGQWGVGWECQYRRSHPYPRIALREMSHFEGPRRFADTYCAGCGYDSGMSPHLLLPNLSSASTRPSPPQA